MWIVEGTICFRGDFQSRPQRIGRSRQNLPAEDTLRAQAAACDPCRERQAQKSKKKKKRRLTEEDAASKLWAGNGGDLQVGQPEMASFGCSLKKHPKKRAHECEHSQRVSQFAVHMTSGTWGVSTTKGVHLYLGPPVMPFSPFLGEH